MLWAETASPNLVYNGTDNTAITVGRFGESVYSQIRRFVVVKVHRQRHFVYACAISTYGDQGVLKPGCNASEHTIVYLRGQQPVYLRGERERGMEKDPIQIEPTDDREQMKPASRVRLGKIHPIEWNVKVRDIGMVSPGDMSKLVRYYREENDSGFDADDY
ncbi:hypothetical protein EJ02DRAFT_444991 [Clathrospora elynae]|uniref:DUF6590 domain-containing protein n=1 Tax=Clathrospora elynae TaxID=706981 RepID=A0A6A5SKM5_9PLEO|nr:hypothetical protein EJ02DRAFT_444991 [Clathrospora elynae]